jgi:serine protease Do
MRRLGFAFCLGAALAVGFSSADARGAPDSFADLSAKLLPTVVGIATTQTLKNGQKAPMPELPAGSPLNDLLKNFFGGGAPRRISSVGSGFIIDASGLIVTNNHVVAGAEQIAVTLNTGETLKAKLIGRDEKTDLALLKVQPKRPLPTAHFGDSNRARVGDWVIAIGNPFGLGSTVTAGIVSARNRDIDSGPYDDFIQTDAPINKGNSGGPLFDMDGNVVGVNSAIFSPTGGSVGIAFAIPSNMARAITGQLRAFGGIRRGWVGVNIQPAPGGGAAVVSVAGNGPAAKAGIRSGDIIVGFDGKKISDSRALARLAADTAVGKTVGVDIRRGSARFSVRLTVQRAQ